MTLTPDDRPRPPRFGYERVVVLLGFLAGLPGAAVALSLLWLGDYPPRVQWTLSAVVVVAWLLIVQALRERVIRPLQTLSNLLAALLEGDYSFRSRAPDTHDALGLAFHEVNALGERLREQRLGALEATALLRKVMAEIDVAVFAFDNRGKLRLVNRAGQRMLADNAERILGQDAQALGLDAFLGHEGEPTIMEAAFPGRAGRFEVRTSAFRQGGLPHRLLVLTDLSRTLREEERQAWKRIIRVFGHEINNSLAPIRSIAESLRGLLGRDTRPADFEEDLQRGLQVISQRSESLGRFMGAYARLARLPPPEPEPVRVEDWVTAVARLETRLPIAVRSDTDAVVRGDPDQLQQLLINLVQNAAEAALETGGAVEIGWSVRDGRLELHVDDEGPGIADTANLFVPFFTTKPKGTGIGLVLSREIAEKHGGTLTLQDRPDGSGCRARLVLPVQGPPANGG